MIRHAGLGLLALIACGRAALAQTIGPAGISCNQTFAVTQGAAALTRIVAAGGRVISWCGWVVNAGAAAGGAQLEFGTGTNCASGTVALTPAWSLGVNGTLVDHVPVAGASLPQGADLCLVTTGTGPMGVMVYFGIN